MKKGTFTGWRKPLAAALGAVLVFSAVCGAGSVLPAGVKEALPEEVRETVEPITAQASGNDKAMSPGAAVLETTSNTADAQIVHFGGDKEWYVIGYGGSGVASASGNMTLIAKDNLKTGVQFNPNYSAAGANHYNSSTLKTEVEAIANTLPEKAYIATRDLAVGTYNGINTDGVAGTEVDGAILWPLSTKEADGMNQELRKAGDYCWLRSPGAVMTTRRTSTATASSTTTAITCLMTTAFVPLLI